MIAISTWNFGLPANKVAWEIIAQNGTALDAVEHGVRHCEADPEVRSVGYGGLPDKSGIVTLDACIMDHYGNCGSVAYVKDIKHPITLARRVMERTNHVMLVGEGASQFAESQGINREFLLTDDARTRWKQWKKKQEFSEINWENHDTICMLAMDSTGLLAGASTTSGIAWKMHGRVGDSPIIGAGLYVDGSVGAAAATGRGESVMKMCGSFLIVEYMRNGATAQQACIMAAKRLAQQQKDWFEYQVGFIALDIHGNYGAFSLKHGFQYALSTTEGHQLCDAQYLETP
ncbi:MAG: N(4)-(beta-N-acetylglucosaminyl)-L-asparaginase [Candidatus Kapabacteria bacterium]|nr:N(4)-(beta-N-acetylglucosaminyl)-L-asparaginase [Candidatus Kapabacteria bacterium]